jgi:hypothetical protein
MILKRGLKSTGLVDDIDSGILSSIGTGTEITGLVDDIDNEILL